MEFREYVSFALVSQKEAPEIFSSFTKDLPGSFPVLYNLQTKRYVSKVGAELHAYFADLAQTFRAQALQNQANFEELTFDLYNKGVCNATDHKFCLVILFRTEAD